MPEHSYVSRGGEKLAAALNAFAVDPAGKVCADLGSNIGGFVDCLLRRGAARVYAVDTGYGTLAYTLRKDPRVVVRERSNAMHVQLPEPADLVTIDVAWTRQRHILPNAAHLLAPQGRIITLIKPHYEAERRQLQQGVLPPPLARQVASGVAEAIPRLGLAVLAMMPSPIPGTRGNTEFLALLAPIAADPD